MHLEQNWHHASLLQYCRSIPYAVLYVPKTPVGLLFSYYTVGNSHTIVPRLFSALLQDILRPQYFWVCWCSLLSLKLTFVMCLFRVFCFLWGVTTNTEDLFCDSLFVSWPCTDNFHRAEGQPRWCKSTSSLPAQGVRNPHSDFVLNPLSVVGTQRDQENQLQPIWILCSEIHYPKINVIMANCMVFVSFF